MTVYKGSAAQSELSQGSNAFAEGYKGSQKVYAKSGGIPTFGTRLNNMCTVVGTITDSVGQDLVYAVLDSSYRTTNSYKWGTSTSLDTSLVNYTLDNWQTDPNSATENVNIILNNYDPSAFPAFNFARNAGTITIKGTPYNSQLPNLTELWEIAAHIAELDSLDPTTTKKLSSIGMGTWSSQESSGFYGFDIYNFANNNTRRTSTGIKSIEFPVIPIFEIPVSAFM